jgi:P27 family predicted phage terminase small subunit
MNDISNKFKDYLLSAHQFEKVDEALIDELLFNIELSQQCRKDILTEGYKINVTQRKGGRPYWVKSQSLNIYNQTIKNINMIMNSLGITVRERQKLKLALENIDEFDTIMNS